MTPATRFELPGRPQPITIDAVLALLPVSPYATSRSQAWGGVTVDLHREAPRCAASYAAFDHHAVYYCPGGSGRLIQGRDGVVHDGVISAGMSLLMPAGYDSTWEGHVPSSVRLRVPTALVDAAAEQLGAPGGQQVEIRNMFEMRDGVIERLAQLLMAELELQPHPTQPLIAEAVSCALAAHLLRSYNAFEVADAASASLLGRRDLARLIAFIEDNIGQTITLADLAAVAGVSRFHFARIFKRSTGVTAIHFVEQARIRRAQSLIAESDLPLVMVAAMTGFADQSHFTRRFQRHAGCTPAVFAREQGRRRPSRRGAQ